MKRGRNFKILPAAACEILKFYQRRAADTARKFKISKSATDYEIIA